MAEFIEKQAAIDAINHELLCGSTADACGLETAYDLIHELKPADVRPVVRGRWIVRETAYGDTEAKCSECGFTTLINEPGNGLHMLSDLNYCSGCGSYNGGDTDG